MMTEITSKAVFGKVAKIMLAVRKLSKDGNNTYDNYRYISADNAFETIGKAMADVGLVALPTVVELTTEVGQSQGGKSQLRTLIHGQITLADAETGDTWTSDWYGEGVDRGDKSINKAMTAMMKYYLLRLFMVGSGEDADSESPEIEQPVKRQPPTTQHRAPRPPAAAARKANPVPDDVQFMDDNPFDDVPDHHANDQAVKSTAASLYSSDIPMSELASRFIAKCHELHGTSGNKTLSTTNKDGSGAGQYGLLAGKIDHIIGVKQHGALLSALVGAEVNKENPPGWKVKEIIDWLNGDASKASTEQAIRDVWAALQQMAVG
jgi:hypothetical protein